jgi:hypothetical protein
MSDFGKARPKPEGGALAFDMADLNLDNYSIMSEYKDPDAIETTYVERRVPIELEDELHEYIDAWLRASGFDPDEL